MIKVGSKIKNLLPLEGRNNRSFLAKGNTLSVTHLLAEGFLIYAQDENSSIWVFTSTDENTTWTEIIEDLPIFTTYAKKYLGFLEYFKHE